MSLSRPVRATAGSLKNGRGLTVRIRRPRGHAGKRAFHTSAARRSLRPPAPRKGKKEGAQALWTVVLQNEPAVRGEAPHRRRRWTSSIRTGDPGHDDDENHDGRGDGECRA